MDDQGSGAFGVGRGFFSVPGSLEADRIQFTRFRGVGALPHLVPRVADAGLGESVVFDFDGELAGFADVFLVLGLAKSLVSRYSFPLRV